MATIIVNPFYVSGGTSSTLLTGLVSWWEGEDGTDSHGSNNLTAINSATVAAGLVGNALSCDFTGPQAFYIADGSQSGLDPSGSFTIACWFSMTTANSAGKTIIGKYGTTGNQRAYRLYLDSTEKLNYQFSEDGNNVTGGSYNSVLSTATWYCLVFTFNSLTGDILVYLNNSEVINTPTAHASCYDGGAPFCIGMYMQTDLTTTANPFEGLVDEAALWSRVLTADERAEYYNSGAGIAYPG